MCVVVVVDNTTTTEMKLNVTDPTSRACWSAEGQLRPLRPGALFPGRLQCAAASAQTFKARLSDRKVLACLDNVSFLPKRPSKAQSSQSLRPFVQTRSSKTGRAECLPSVETEREENMGVRQYARYST